jgi:N6-adenosine-specific RNA methylase IME4
MPDLFRDIASTGLIVNQIQIEMHRSSKNVENITSFFELVDKAKMRIFHKERNGWGCNGHMCIEYSFISEDFLRKANKAAIC